MDNKKAGKLVGKVYEVAREAGVRGDYTKLVRWALRQGIITSEEAALMIAYRGKKWHGPGDGKITRRRYWKAVRKISPTADYQDRVRDRRIKALDSEVKYRNT
jgi:hypothetical protein